MNTKKKMGGHLYTGSFAQYTGHLILIPRV